MNSIRSAPARRFRCTTPLSRRSTSDRILFIIWRFGAWISDQRIAIDRFSKDTVQFLGLDAQRHHESRDLLVWTRHSGPQALATIREACVYRASKRPLREPE